ncbi:MAG: hypothetical protein A3E88_02690 [Legionellales bacterium RIFCSPHIGHO2_12_FULL_35_11]|nr:MAG: hypothetical protein A3E88_02690 [Legionellales bacterium RIFCSPHIGHO2_12_FULL_35_11]
MCWFDASGTCFEVYETGKKLENDEVPMYTIDEIINDVETWLVTGKLNIQMLSENFEFNSPFWKKANKNDFIKQFEDPTEYKKAALSKITHFDPLIKYKDDSGKQFAIVLQYHTRNDQHVYETVIGTVENGLLTDMRSIYDLNETKEALEIN